MNAPQPAPTDIASQLQSYLRHATHNGNLGVTKTVSGFEIGYIYETAMGNEGSVARFDNQRIHASLNHALKKAGMPALDSGNAPKGMPVTIPFSNGSAIAALGEDTLRELAAPTPRIR